MKVTNEVLIELKHGKKVVVFTGMLVIDQWIEYLISQDNRTERNKNNIGSTILRELFNETF